MARYWGCWTRGKLDLLRRYLNAFNTASKNKADERIYLDLFGGQPENVERGSNEPVDGSARIALLAEPGFTRLRFFEMEPNATKLRSALDRDFAGRDFQVIAGDCNANLAATLDGLSSVNWAPTFAFVDPNGPDVKWSTLETLSKFRHGKTKAEIWMLLAAGLFIRNLPTDGSVRPKDAAKLDDLYGTGQWRAIYDARVAGRLDGREARDEYVNLMRWRLETVLGYQWTHPFEVFNQHNTSIYHMIFATDHPAGTKIMSDLYTQALSDFPAMVEAARRRDREAESPAMEQIALFAGDVGTIPDTRPIPKYRYQAPTAPYGSID